MKRLPHVAILLVAVALVAADKGEKKKGDAEKIQGIMNSNRLEETIRTIKVNTGVPNYL